MPTLNDRRIGDDVRRVCDERRPDVAIVDCMLPPAHAAVDQLSIRRVVLTHTYKAFYDGPYRRTSGLVSLLYGYNAVRQWDSARANLVTSIESLDPAARGRHAANVRWTGVIGAAAAEARPTDGPPLVLVSLSTNGFPGQRRTLRRIVAALGQLPVRGVITTGGVFAPDEFSAPDNVRVLGYADHLSILPECSLVIAHGGHSTTFRALAHGVPILTIPTSRMTDQPMIGRSISDAGAGRMLRRSSSALTIRDAVESILGEPGFRRVAGTLGAEIRGVDGATNAVDAIERVASR